MTPKLRAYINERVGMVWVRRICFYPPFIDFEWENEIGITQIYSEDLDQVKLMQSTGLEDKNGVEIYEGDYLSWISFESQKEFKGEVIFSKGSFCMVVGLKGHDYKVPLHELSNSDNLLEVLGNIYENPELLEVAE